VLVTPEVDPAAMIFVQSREGTCCNPREFTPDADLADGANILLDAVQSLAGEALDLTAVPDMIIVELGMQAAGA